MRTLLATLIALAFAAPAAANEQTCDTLRPDVFEHALDRALTRSSEGDLASMSTRTYMLVENCRPLGRRRATFGYRIVVKSYDRSAVLVDEHGEMIVTRNRATFIPATPPAPVL